MRAFAQLFTEIEQTTKTNAKVDALVRYFELVDEEDMLWCIAVLTGNRPKRSVRTGELKTWCAALSGLPDWLFEESYHIVGDLAETITLCLPPAGTYRDHSLAGTMHFLMGLQQASDGEKKIAITARWMQMDKTECFVFNKLITGNFRMGVSRQLVIKALSRYLDMEENLIAHRLMGQWQPQQTTLQALLHATEEQRHYQPYPFYLAYPLEAAPEDLGDIRDWQVETKYDGIRGQIIVRNHELFVWSRGEELVTDKFPEFALLKELLPDGTVIDGEILAYKHDAPLPFQVMQTRIGRKTITKKILQDAPIVMICYDLLELQGEDIRERPLSYRRGQLELLLEQVKAPCLLLSPAHAAQHWDEVKDARLNARINNGEGVMLKHKNSSYEVGRRRGNWWKWKVDPLTVDGVLIYAQSGHGRRANLYTDYTFAVWDGDALVPFAKAYSGLTDKEILQVDAWVKAHTVEKFGPVRSVQPELVFELAFEGINRSPRHKSGVALRFPRILRWRHDKTAAEANTRQDLLDLIDKVNHE